MPEPKSQPMPFEVRPGHQGGWEVRLELPGTPPRWLGCTFENDARTLSQLPVVTARHLGLLASLGEPPLTDQERGEADALLAAYQAMAEAFARAGIAFMQTMCADGARGLAALLASPRA